MKKIFLIAAAAVLLAAGSAAFAQELDFKPGPPRPGSGYNQFTPGRRDQVREFAASAREKQDLIKKQRAEIRDLRYRLEKQVRQVRLHLARLKKQQGPLDPAKIGSIKQSLEAIRQAQQVLGSTEESFRARSRELGEARGSRRPEAFLKALDDIIKIQKTRIESLTGIVTSLERLNGELG